jgi:glutathione S-transferase
MAAITLYGPPEAPFTMKVKGALAFKKLEYENVEPTSPDDYRAWSPTGLLPALDHDGARIPDSGAILDYLDERFPEPPLLSEDPKTASQQLRLEVWVEASFMFYWRNYLKALVEGGDTKRARKSPLADEFSQRLDDLANFLGDRPFYYADRLSRADLAVYSFLRPLGLALGRDIESALATRDALAAHLHRVEAEIPDIHPR